MIQEQDLKDFLEIKSKLIFSHGRTRKDTDVLNQTRKTNIETRNKFE